MKESHIHFSERDLFNELISQTYIQYLPQIRYYILLRTGSVHVAEDLAQDAFIRLIDYTRMLRSDTIKSFIFTIVRNIVIDYLRLHARRKEELSANMLDFNLESSSSFESYLHAKDIQKVENSLILKMPKKRKKVYILDRFSHLSAHQISVQLSISKRTVENHLFNSRNQVRQQILKCV